MSAIDERKAPWVHLWRWCRAYWVAVCMIPSTAALTKDTYDGKIELTEDGPRDVRNR
jgi:hypothetical protein